METHRLLESSSRVLIADDDDMFRGLLARRTGKMGWTLSKHKTTKLFWKP